MASAGGAGGAEVGSAEGTSRSRRRARAAHPDAGHASLFVGNGVTPELCCAICFEPFVQARAATQRSHNAS
jgi:hypothetical protein